MIQTGAANKRPAGNGASASLLHILRCGRAVPDAERWALELWHG
jgi:hypothetical protein